MTTPRHPDRVHLRPVGPVRPRLRPIPDQEAPMPDLSMSSKLPGGATNGLAALLAELLDEPTQVRAAIVLYDVSKITEDPGTGDRVPQVRIRSIEPVTGDGDAAEIRRMFRRAAERRTGQAELPLELEREIDAIFDGDEGDQRSPQDRPGWGVGPDEPEGPGHAE